MSLESGDSSERMSPTSSMLAESPTSLDYEMGLKRSLLGKGYGRSDASKTYSQVLLITSILLHSSLLAIHIGFAVMIYLLDHPERAFVVPLDTQGTVSTIVTVLLQMTGITWTAVLLLTTQQLVVLRDLGTRRTLTATHDSDMAWSGLGRSLLTLWRQFEVPAHVGGTLLAVIYLIAISALHITTPSLFVVEAFNQTVVIEVNTTGGTDWQNPDTQLFEYVYQVQATRTLASLPTLPETKGLYDSLIYEVLDDNTGYGPVDVAARRYAVDCSHKPHSASAIVDTDSPADYGSDWVVKLDIDGSGDTAGEIYLMSMVQDALNIRVVFLDAPDNVQEYDMDLSGPDQKFVYAIVTPMRIVDSANMTGTRLVLNEPMSYTDRSGERIDIWELSLAVCTLDMMDTTIQVDAQTKEPIHPPRSEDAPDKHRQVPDSKGYNVFEPSTDIGWWRRATRNSTAWDDFEGISGAQFDDPLELCGGFFEIACHSLLYTYLEGYVMSDLNIHPNLDRNASGSDVLALKDLQHTMSQTAAALFWSTTHPLSIPFELSMMLSSMSNDVDGDSYYKGNDTFLKVPATHGKTFSRSREIAAHLSLVPPAVIAGLITSVILFAVVVPIFRTCRQTREDEIDSVGLLQVTWILQGHPDIQRKISEVEVPTSSNLRRAGMMEINLMSLDD